ncbi:MAG TPA: hypothetical protein PKI33_08425 [Anaerolineales bacterium]|nr:hypothetical protein [Anaerolineales bacterium]
MEIKHLGDAVLNDILSSNVESLSMIETVPHEIALIHNGQGYNVELGLLSVGKVHDSVYSKFPPVPKNLKFVVIILSQHATRAMMGSALEILDRVFFRRKMTAVVASMQEAEAQIMQMGFSG